MTTPMETVFERWDVQPFDRVPNRRAGLDFLTMDGDLGVPCSRYGRRSSDCAEVAWRLAFVVAREQGTEPTYELLDFCMGLVVNDHDDVADVIRGYGNGHYR